MGEGEGALITQISIKPGEGEIIFFVFKLKNSKYPIYIHYTYQIFWPVGEGGGGKGLLTIDGKCNGGIRIFM